MTTEATDKVTVKATTLAAVLADASVFAGADANRPILNAVRFTACNGRGQVIGCDSYVLGAFTFDAEGTMSALIALDDVKRIIVLVKAELKGSRSYGAVAEIVLERDGDTLTVRTRDAQVSARLVDGDYPRFRELMGEPAATTFVGYTTKTLGQVAKVRMGESSTHALGIALEPGGPLKPSRISAHHNGIDFVGLVMPNRMDAPASELEVVEIAEAKK